MKTYWSVLTLMQVANTIDQNWTLIKYNSICLAGKIAQYSIILSNVVVDTMVALCPISTHDFHWKNLLRFITTTEYHRQLFFSSWVESESFSLNPKYFGSNQTTL